MEWEEVLAPSFSCYEYRKLDLLSVSSSFSWSGMWYQKHIFSNSVTVVLLLIIHREIFEWRVNIGFLLCAKIFWQMMLNLIITTHILQETWSPSQSWGNHGWFWRVGRLPGYGWGCFMDFLHSSLPASPPCGFHCPGLSSSQRPTSFSITLDIRISTYKLGWRVVQTFRPQHGLIVYSRNVIEILLCPGNRVRAARSDNGYLRLSMTLLSNKVENTGNIWRQVI